MQDLTGFETWLRAEGKAEKTIRAHLYGMKDYVAQYQDISRQNGEAWIDSLRELASEKTLSSRISAFNVYCKYCGKGGERLHYTQEAVEKAASREFTAHRCEGCYYRRPIVKSQGAITACHYCIDTGKPRGIPVSLCYGHDGTPYRPEPYRPGSQRPEIVYGKKVG